MSKSWSYYLEFDCIEAFKNFLVILDPFTSFCVDYTFHTIIVSYCSFSLICEFISIDLFDKCILYVFEEGGAL